MDVPMELILCAHCGMPFAMSRDKKERLRKCHNTFYCPDGHAQSFVGKTEEERLREKVKELEDVERKRKADEFARRLARQKSSKKTANKKSSNKKLTKK